MVTDVIDLVLEAGELIELAKIVVTTVKEIKEIKIISEINEIKLGQVNEKLDQLLQTTSEVILRDVRSAYKALGDYLYLSRRGEAKPEKLERIEDILQRNTGLNPEGKTGDVSNADIMAMSYLGLTYVHTIKGELSMADRYILRMFEAGPRVARHNLAPAVFEKYFLPYCEECFEQHNDDLRRRPDITDHLERVGRGAAAAVVGGLGTLAALGLRTGSVAGASVKAAGEIMKGGNMQYVEWASEEKLLERHEARLDDRCREIARELLTK